jgi:hypothetical protein
MSFLSRLKKHKKPAKPTEAKTPERKPVEKIGYHVSEEELKRAERMASILASNEVFAKFCRARKLGDPTEAFMKFYKVVSENKAVWKLEAKTEDAALEAEKTFSRTAFYGELFMRCKGDPLRVTSLLFKAKR